MKARVCPSGKRRFNDRISALFALSQAGNRNHTRREKDEVRAYRCPKCNGWHLTAKKRWVP